MRSTPRSATSSPFVGTSSPASSTTAAQIDDVRRAVLDLASGLAWESQLFASLFATDDRREGMAAFIAKRKPDFTGR